MSVPASWWPHAVLTVREMAQADGLAAKAGKDGSMLMRAAGQAVADTLCREFPDAEGFDILCGPGNNGGDGYVAAQALKAHGRSVSVWALAKPKGKDAVRAAADWSGPIGTLENFTPDAARVAVDALFGAGLSRPLGGTAAALAQVIEKSGMAVAAIDLPSGIAGDTGVPLGPCLRASLTVTFAWRKPAHLLYPGRRLCGRIELADIGIPAPVMDEIRPQAFQNGPELWRDRLPWPEVDTHKYRRGHLAVCSGPVSMTGAARLAAAAGARAGAGAVTLLSPGGALAVNAAQLTAVMVRRMDAAEAFEAFLQQSRVRAVVLGPGFGDLEKARAFALALLARPSEEEVALVLDADGITAFRDSPSLLFTTARGTAPRLVLTPHEGEFGRLFPDLAAGSDLSKIEKARHAAARANAILILKGPDTVVAEPGGFAVVNTNATPFLATAGAGDVLAGLCGGLLAQSMPLFPAACAAVWLHAEAARRFGPGLTAEDLPAALPLVLRDLAPPELL